MAYLISEGNIDRLLNALQVAHAKASATPFWPIIKTEPEVVEILSAVAAVESEVRKNRDAAPNVLNLKPYPKTVDVPTVLSVEPVKATSTGGPVVNPPSVSHCPHGYSNPGNCGVCRGKLV